MTLRARLAVGLVFMGLVMAVGGFAVVRTIADSQRRQLDALISDTLPEVASIVPATGKADSAGVVVFGKLYVARVEADGTRQIIADPSTGAEPRIPGDAVGTWVPASSDGVPGSTFGEIVDVDSVAPGSERWRAVVLDDPASGARLLVAVSQADTDDTNSRLIWASFAVAVAGLGRLLPGRLVGGAVRAPPDQRRRRDRPGDRVRRPHPSRARSTTPAPRPASWPRSSTSWSTRTSASSAGCVGSSPMPRTSSGRRSPRSAGSPTCYRRGSLEEPEMLDDAMRRIGGESARMALLIDDLLLLARLDEGRPLAAEPVDLDGILRDAVLDVSASHPTALDRAASHRGRPGHRRRGAAAAGGRQPHPELAHARRTGRLGHASRPTSTATAG